MCLHTMRCSRFLLRYQRRPLEWLFINTVQISATWDSFFLKSETFFVFMASSGLSPSGLNFFFLEPRYWVTELWPRRWKRCLWLVQNHHSKKASVTRIHIQHIDLQLNNTFPTVSTESAGLHTVWSQSRRQGTTCNAKTLQKNKSLWSQWLLHHICPNNTTRLHKTCIWKKERTKKINK